MGRRFASVILRELPISIPARPQMTAGRTQPNPREEKGRYWRKGISTPKSEMTPRMLVTMAPSAVRRNNQSF